MEDIKKKLDRYNEQIISKLAFLHGAIADQDHKDMLMDVVKLIGERDSVSAEFINKAMQDAIAYAENMARCMNYVHFDLEATRRERDKYLKRLNGEADD